MLCEILCVMLGAERGAGLTPLTVHHVSQFEEDSLLTPLTVDQLAELLSRLVGLRWTSEDSRHHQHEVLQRHRQQHLDAFVAAGRRSAADDRKLNSERTLMEGVKAGRPTWPPWPPPCVQPALCSTRCGRSGSRSDAA